MKILPLLSRLGLNEDEGKIYMSLLEQGPANIMTLAKRTGLYRPRIYKLLPELTSKQLVATQKSGNRVLFVTENPAQLKSFVNRLAEEVDSVSGELFRTYRNAKRRPIINNFEGKEGIRHVFEEMMNLCKKGDVIYRYESPQDYNKIKKYYPRLYLAKAAGAGDSMIDKFVITNEKTQRTRRQRLERYSKCVPKNFDLFEYDITLLVYHNRVVFIDYKREAVNVIESARYAEFQKQLFKLLFKSL
jgi:sugar-specific transcriptional regulator TrmB